VRIAASVLVIIVLIVTVVQPMLKRLLYPDAKPEGSWTSTTTPCWVATTN
jgi:hypothetical protein